ncbi:MAG: hypothetical protein CL846_09255 [Crocinitomicaceae bacterium]|nr:hypothetical protein [Crocinitomicaceae bacterium]
MNFSDLKLNPDLLKGVDALGFTEPTSIQEATIPQLLEEKKDLVGLAQTGTGKTAAFGLPMIHKINPKDKTVQGLVIAPTRELCVQISNDFKNFSKFMSGIKIATIYGGASMDKQSKEIRAGAQIIVATPGRLMDLMRRKMVKINQVNYVALDEADEMLNMGFKEDIDDILRDTPDDKVTWLFSATMPKQVEKIAKSYMTNPIEVTVGGKNIGAENIKHVYYSVKDRDRYLAVKRILDFHPSIYGLIFCRTRRVTQEIADKLLKEGYNAAPIHGDLSQDQRDKTMRKFRDKTLQILVATDVAARGIDVNDITHVINYHLPDDVESYTHRSGRTARAGKEGTSIAIVTGKEQSRINQIERHIKVEFNKESLPSGKEVCEQQLISYIEKIKTVTINETEIADFIPAISKTLSKYTKEELIKRFVSNEFNQLLDYYENSRNLDNNDSSGKKSYKSNEDQERFFINLGYNKGLNKGGLLRLICTHANIDSSSIGELDLSNDFSFFEVDNAFTENVLNGMKGQDFDGKSFVVEIASKDKKKRGRSGGRDRSRGRSRDRGRDRSRNKSKDWSKGRSRDKGNKRSR